MFIRLLLLFLLWLVIRRIWRAYSQPRSRKKTTQRDPYPGPQNSKGQYEDITQQKISEAEFEELDDSDR